MHFQVQNKELINRLIHRFCYVFENLLTTLARSSCTCRGALSGRMVGWRQNLSADSQGAILVKEIFTVRAAVLAPSPQPAPATAASRPSAPAGAPRSQTARETMNMPTRVSAASPTGAAPAPKSDAPDFKLAPARAAAAPAPLVRAARSSGTGVPGVGGRSGTSGGDGGNDYFAPEEGDQVCPVCQAPTTASGREGAGSAKGVCKRAPACELAHAAKASAR